MLEAQRKGRRVKTLEERPTLPAHLAIVAQARQDIGEGSDVGSVAQWFQAAGVAPTSREFFWLLDRLRAVEAAHFAGSSNG
jgi:hypothetical protein